MIVARFTVLLLLAAVAVVDAVPSKPQGLTSGGVANLKKAAFVKKVASSNGDLLSAATQVVTGTPSGGGSPSISQAEKGSLIWWGDVGNILTALLSTALLVLTPFNTVPQPLGTDCTADGFQMPLDGDPDKYSGPLDQCYVMDGFCVTNPTSEKLNSHMLSLYVDTLLAWKLWGMRTTNLDELDDLGLSQFYVSQMKVASVFGHGLAHWFLSVLSFSVSVSSDTHKSLVQGGLLVSLLGMFGGLLAEPISKLLGIKSVRDSRGETFPQRAREIVAPLFAASSLVLMNEAKKLKIWVKIFGLDVVVFAAVCFIFFYAGIPPSDDRLAFAKQMTLLATIATTVLGVDAIGESFIMVFTATYLVSSIYQVFLWDGKGDNPRGYAVTAWASNLLTTVVGCAIGLACTSLLPLGGHWIYDASIGVSYWLIFEIMRQFGK